MRSERCHSDIFACRYFLILLPVFLLVAALWHPLFFPIFAKNLSHVAPLDRPCTYCHCRTRARLQQTLSPRKLLQGREPVQLEQVCFCCSSEFVLKDTSLQRVPRAVCGSRCLITLRGFLFFTIFSSVCFKPIDFQHLQHPWLGAAQPMSLLCKEMQHFFLIIGATFPVAQAF